MPQGGGSRKCRSGCLRTIGHPRPGPGCLGEAVQQIADVLEPRRRQAPLHREDGDPAGHGGERDDRAGVDALDLRRDRWRSINGTFGVMSLIMAEERPTPVPRGVVETIIDYVDESGICRFDRDLMEGQAIRVTSGPLAEAVGELVRLDKSGRVRVLLEIMGGRVLATIERSSLVAA